MFEIHAENAAEYLRRTGRVSTTTPVQVRELGGGVSNVVLRVDVEGQPPFVLKQSRTQLRTRAEWFSRLDRIWIERDAMRLLSSLLPEGAVPSIVFEDPEDYLFAMTCAPDDSVVWKAQLLDGRADPEVARHAGTLLGTIHAHTESHPELSVQFGDTTVFDQLRIDPFYRRIAQVHPELSPRLARLIDSMAEVPVRTLVHADFSPKNLLVHAHGLTLVDHETAHAGDPAFDLGFFLSHLFLKALRAGPRSGDYFALIYAFWETYQASAGLDADRVRRSIGHLGGCALARIDGKSPVNYRDDLDLDLVRRLARTALAEPPPDWETLVELAARELHNR
jgi:5-methylthioribose kinase